nr:gamma-glutamyl-phosphate reductase [Clostridia bacterium]
MIDLNELGIKAKAAAAALADTPESVINNALIRAANALVDNREEIKAANAEDIENAKRKGLSAAFIDRLALTDKVIGS